MRNLFLVLLLLSYGTICFALPDYAGKYKCKGYDPYLDKWYTGTVTIKPQNTVYNLWMEYSTGEKARGTGGLFEEDTISVVFQDIKNLRKVGLERYSLSSDKKSIQGYWVYLGKDKLGKEVCQKKNK